MSIEIIKNENKTKSEITDKETMEERLTQENDELRKRLEITQAIVDKLALGGTI